MAAASSDPSPKEESKKTDPPEMHLLDEILSRAQRIRESQPEVAKTSHFVLSIVSQGICHPGRSKEEIFREYGYQEHQNGSKCLQTFWEEKYPAKED